MIVDWIERLRSGNRNTTGRQKWEVHLKPTLKKPASDEPSVDFPQELAVAALQTEELRCNLHVVLDALCDAIKEEHAVERVVISDLAWLWKTADASVQTLRACVCALVDGCRRSSQPMFLLRHALICCGHTPGFELPSDGRKQIGMIGLDMVEVIREALIAPGQPSEANLRELFCVTSDTDNTGDKGWFSRTVLMMDISRGAMYLRETNGAFDPHSIRPMGRTASYTLVPFDRLQRIIETAKKNVKDTQADRYCGMSADNWREVLQAASVLQPGEPAAPERKPLPLREDVPWATKDAEEMRSRCEKVLSFLAEKIEADCPNSTKAVEVIEALTELIVRIDDDEQLKRCIHSLYEQGRRQCWAIVTAALVLSDCGFQLQCAPEAYEQEVQERRIRFFLSSGSVAGRVYRELLQPLKERREDARLLFVTKEDALVEHEYRISESSSSIVIDVRTGVLYSRYESRSSDMGNMFAGTYFESFDAFSYDGFDHMIRYSLKYTGKQDAARFAGMTMDNWRDFVPEDQ